MGEPRRVMRLLVGAAASAALALSAAGCSSDDHAGTRSADASATTTSPALADAPSTSARPAAGGVTTATTATIIIPTTNTTIAAAAITTTTTTSAGAGTATAVTTATAVDGAAVLQAALDATAAGYHYHGTVTVGGVVAIEIDGDRIGDGTRLGVVRDGIAVQYVITPDGTWVQPDGGDWDQLDTPPATSDPILALRSPAAVSVDAIDGDSVRMTVQVPAVSLGLTGDALVPLTVVVTGGTLAQVVYTTTIDGQPAAIDTAVGPALDPSPVVAPV